jgi:hypothetical protein
MRKTAGCDMPTDSQRSDVSYRVDEARCRVFATLEGPVAGPHFNRAVNGLFESRPELVEYDFVYNLLRYTGEVSHSDLDVHASVYRKYLTPASADSYTVIVTLDRSFGYWVEVMKTQFPNRLFKIVPTLTEAQAFLDGLHGQAA